MVEVHRDSERSESPNDEVLVPSIQDDPDTAYIQLRRVLRLLTTNPANIVTASFLVNQPWLAVGRQGVVEAFLAAAINLTFSAFKKDREVGNHGKQVVAHYLKEAMKWNKSGTVRSSPYFELARNLCDPC